MVWCLPRLLSSVFELFIAEALYVLAQVFISSYFRFLFVCFGNCGCEWDCLSISPFSLFVSHMLVRLLISDAHFAFGYFADFIKKNPQVSMHLSIKFRCIYPKSFNAFVPRVSMHFCP